MHGVGPALRQRVLLGLADHQPERHGREVVHHEVRRRLVLTYSWTRIRFGWCSSMPSLASKAERLALGRVVGPARQQLLQREARPVPPGSTSMIVEFWPAWSTRTMRYCRSDRLRRRLPRAVLGRGPPGRHGRRAGRSRRVATTPDLTGTAAAGNADRTAAGCADGGMADGRIARECRRLRSIRHPRPPSSDLRPVRDDRELGHHDDPVADHGVGGSSASLMPVAVADRHVRGRSGRSCR